MSVEAPAPERDDVAAAETEEAERRARPWLPLLGLVAILAIPLVIALAALRRPQWFPILDLSMTELRVRDVGGRDTPLIGLPGRIGTLSKQGSHPGPLSFYVLAPFYRLFGSTAWAMEAATVCLHLLASSVCVWIAHRRGGLRLALGVTAVLALLMRLYGTGTMTEPWNPYMPLIWWVVLLLAVWSVYDGDLPMLPVGAFAASFCAHTHSPYLGLAGGMGALAVAGVVWVARRADAAQRRAALRWTLIAAALLLVLWAPPIIDQLWGSQPNITMLIDHFGSPPEEPVGLGKGVELMVLHLDVWRLFTGQEAATGSLVDASQSPAGSLVPGVVFLGVWVGTVVAAWRTAHRALLRLDLVLGVAVILGVISISRIFGQLWYYLMIWAWGITALMVLAVVWTGAEILARRRPGPRPLGTVALGVVIVVSTVVFSIDATDAEPPALPLSRTMSHLVPDTVDDLDRDATYLVTWTDALYIGSQGIALLNELERNGLEVGAIEPWGVPSTRHRVLDPDDADALVHLANGFHLERWRAKPGMVEVATFEPRSPEEIEEFERLRAEVIAELEESGVEDRIVDVDENLFAAAIDRRIPKATQDKMGRMLDLGLPTAVFVGPTRNVE